ncbi:2Fe-2S iron-sulfur cluster-binding protein [Aeromicrobium sp.]|uniref:2Fe-2S iron-sulfur cluster-binding protein n=1 Tax=Aeromicrobium sp. TaxID=1871063 RepID=UPI002FC68ABC
MNDPHIWWYITRASAMVAWILMTVSVLWGVLLATRALRHIDNPGWLHDLHRYLSGLSILMVGLHVISLMLDGWLKFRIAEVLVPFATDFKPVATAIGVIGLYVFIAIQATSMVMHKLPAKFWRAVHLLSYLLLGVVAIHAGMIGTDVGSIWYTVLAITLIATAVLAVVLRLVVNERVETLTASANAHRERPTRTMVVTALTPLAEGALGVRLSALDGAPLPSWQPGAHLTLHLPVGQKQYSLCGDPANRSAYEIAVRRTPDPTGGGGWLHANLAIGETVQVSGPLNHFDLVPAASYLFVAGGIGISPIKSMIESLPAHRAWILHYAGHSRRSMPFVDELERAYPGRVVVHASDEGSRLSPSAVVTGTSSEVYACGPESLMQAVADRAPQTQMHLERFVALERVGMPATPIAITCARAGREVTVRADESVLDALEADGIAVLGSCREGVCGACEVRVLAGSAEHLDSVSDDAEKDAARVMYPCVSRAREGSLVLDV